MRSVCVIGILCGVIGVVSAQGRNGPPQGRASEASPSQSIRWNFVQWPTNRNADFAHQAKEPVKLFDNVYSVGLNTNSSFLITTSAGLVLIDPSWAETVDMVVANIRKSGFDPANIKYVFVTHAQVDHYGGAGRIKELSPGTRIGMSGPDWQKAEEDGKRGATGQQNSKPLPLMRDLVIEDRQAIAVGDTTFTFYVLPGTTPGSLGIAYPARDRGKTYRALATGALGMYGDGAWAKPFITSAQRLKTLGPWDVWLPNHPFMALPRDLADIEKEMIARGNGPNPAVVSHHVVNEYLDFLIKLASQKMAMEQWEARER
jgi:metallo-beta-lactamase class B